MTNVSKIQDQGGKKSSPVESFFGLFKEEFEHAFGMWKKAVTFQYTFDTWAEDVGECGQIWLKGVGSVFGFGFPLPGLDHVPGAVFVVDAQAHSTDPENVILTGIVDANATLGHELREIGTGKNYDAKLNVERSGAVLKISLQDLTTMAAGHSAGVVFVNEAGGSKLPLAHVYVTKIA